MYSYQSFQSSAAADKQKCEGQLRCRGLIDMAGAQRITHRATHTNTRLPFCRLNLCKYPQMHHLINGSGAAVVQEWVIYKNQLHSS